MNALLYAILLLSVINLAALLWLLLRKKDNASSQMATEALDKIEQRLREESKINREESARLSKEQREEAAGQAKVQREENASRGKELREEITASLNAYREEAIRLAKEQREENAKSFQRFQENFDKNSQAAVENQRENFKQMDERQKDLLQSTEKKLEEMRQTVDEKLQKTLNERIGQSFKIVSEQLENVQKGLGEMQNLASDVGGLKKVLSNVKIRGTFGEVQLQALLEQMLSPEQYDANIRTAHSGSERVEFAVKLPGKDDEKSFVYLPIDAKFPKDTYEQYLAACENGEQAQIEEKSKLLETTIKKMAKDIHDKYIDPPYTTDFAILFLPFENIYAEIIRRTGLMDELQQKFKVVVTGPTTLGAILNSLQMGFRTLALQKRSSEVWKTLGAIKTEFSKFGGLLEKAQRNLSTAGKTLEDIMGTRTRAIMRTLKNVEALPADKAKDYLPEIGSDDEEDPFKEDRSKDDDDTKSDDSNDIFS